MSSDQGNLFLQYSLKSGTSVTGIPCEFDSSNNFFYTVKCVVI